MSASEVFVRVGDQVRVFVPHEAENGRDVWCRVDQVRGDWVNVTPIDPPEANVAAFKISQVLEVRHVT